MKFDEAKKLLAKHGQEHLLGHWAKLTASERKALLAQIEGLDFRAVARCAAILKAQRDGAVPAAKIGTPTAPKVAQLKGAARARAIAAGEKELRAGHVGVLLVAGGQGSRIFANGDSLG